MSGEAIEADHVCPPFGTASRAFHVHLLIVVAVDIKKVRLEATLVPSLTGCSNMEGRNDVPTNTTSVHSQM